MQQKIELLSAAQEISAQASAGGHPPMAQQLLPYGGKISR
jgi:hypothetical protein